MVTITIRQLIIGILLLAVVIVFVRWQPEPSPQPHPQSKPALVHPARVSGSETPAKNPTRQLAMNDQKVGGEYGDPALKEAYFCDLARSLRERCERIPRSAESLEFCLKATSYYTNSRYCGHRP